MLSRNNAHFEELKKIGMAYETLRAAHEEKKEQILETYGYGSDELKAWYEEKKEMKFPLPEGACKAYRAWKSTVAYEEDEVAMDDFLWDREVKDFVETLRAAGIESFIYTNKSTAMMDNLHDFEKEGCKMTGLKTIKRMDRRFGEDIEEEIRGVHFSL